MSAQRSVSVRIPGPPADALRRLPVLLRGRPFRVQDGRRVEIREGAEKRISLRFVPEPAPAPADQPAVRAVFTFDGYRSAEIDELIQAFRKRAGADDLPSRA